MSKNSFAFVDEVVGCNLLPWAIGDIPWEHGLCRVKGFVLGADSALVDVISYICINSRPVHYLSCLCLHLIYCLVDSMQVSKGAVE